MLTTRFGVAFATQLLFVSELEVSGFSIFFEGGVLNKVYTGFAFSFLAGWPLEYHF